MKMSVRLRGAIMATAVCILLAIGLLATGLAQDAVSQRPPAERPSIIVDGTHWQNASARERRAFLVGVANMIVAEIAYAKRHNLEQPPVCDQMVKAVTDMKLPDIEARITRWYQAHPQEQSMPVMGVIWKDLVKKESSNG